MYDYIHETVIRDIIDVLSDVKKSDEIQGILNRNKSTRSIAQASSAMTLVFPVAVTRNANIENAGMIAKAIERKAVTMLQMLFSAINISDASNGIDYLKRFHNNIKMGDSPTVDDFMDAMDSFVLNNESVVVDRQLYESVKADLKNLSYMLPDSINESSINDYKVYPQTRFGTPTILKENNYSGAAGPRYTGNHIDNRSDKRHTINNNQTYNIDTKGNGSKDGVSNKMKDVSAVMKNNHDMLRNQIMDTDVKKANELIPTMMIVNYVDVENGDGIPAQMVIGVKAKMYPVDSVDMLTRIRLKNEDNNGLLKFVRATTREISFFRDFIFAIDRAKVDALSQSNRGSSSKMWKILERRALKSKVRRHLGQTNDASAITTIVITQEEVEYLKKNENIDIENPKVIRPIMEAYNLMGVCIIDESMEVAKFIFDTGDDIYETLSFTHLERETSDNGYKKIINLMTKVAR